MAAITALTEDFTGATNGTTIQPTNTIFDSETGTGADSIFSNTNAYTGTLGMLTAPGATDFRSYRADYTAVGTLWINFYFKINTLPTAPGTAIMSFFSGATKVADLRLMVAGTVQLRSNVTAVFVSTAVTVGVWHRAAVQIAPNATGTGVLRLRLYEGASSDSVSPTQDSGAQVAAVVAASTDNLRVGSMTADAALSYGFDRFRGDDATEPAGVGVANIQPVANAGPNQTDVVPGATVTISGAASTDTDGTIVSHAWTQTAGTPTVTLSGTGTANRTFTAPSVTGGTTLTFSLTVTDNLGGVSTPDTMTVQVGSPSSGDIPELTENFDGGTNGAAVTTANTGVENISGLGAASTFVNTPHEGTLAMRTAPGAGGARIHRFDLITAVPTLWVGFYFQVVTAPTGPVAIMSVYSGTSTAEVKLGDVRILTTGAVQLRSVSSDRYTSPVLPAGWYRASVQFSPTTGGTGICRLRIYTDDQTVTFGDSGDQPLSAVAASVDNIRAGAAVADATLVWLMDRMRGNDTTEPAGVGVANNTPTALAEPVGIAALAEDFTGGANGTPITLSPATIFDSETGTGVASTFSTDTGLAAMRTAPGGTDFRTYRADFTAVPDLWRWFYFTLDALPTTTAAIVAFYSGTTKIGDVQVVAATSTLRLRSVSTTVWTSVAVAVGVKHRIVLRVAPVVGGTGVLRMRIHEGTSRDSGVATQDSGDRVASATVASVDNMRTGSLSADATLVWRSSRLRGNTVPPRPGGEPYAAFTLTGGGTDPDTGSSIVAHTWTQLSGPVVPLTGTGTGPRTGVIPATMFGADLVYGLIVTDNLGAVSTQDTATVTALPHNHYARVGGAWLPVRVVTR